jgi:hypothetical protein
MLAKHFLDFRRATSATWQYFGKEQADFLFGFRGINTTPATEKPAPVLAA